jgi:acyl-CoA reductase-like NAD-dependent aldehyde dehydrogenase
VKRYELLIHNEARPPATGEYFVSVSPATGEPLAEFAAAGESDVDLACLAARRAFHDGWRDADPDQRAEVMLRAARIIRDRLPELARAEALDTGKPIAETAGFDIPFSALAFEYFAHAAREVQGHVIPMSREGGRDLLDFVTYEPYGVAVVISPYNYPLHLLTRSLAPALAAGNAVVCKASSMTPWTTAILGEIVVEAGFPPGVVNVVSGAGARVGEALAVHPEVDVVALTGSESVGRRLLELSARSRVIKKNLLELGGKGPTIVAPDADFSVAVSSLVLGVASNQGEVCCAMTRLYLHEDIYEAFLPRLAEALSSLRLGDILDPGTQLGSLISREHRDRVAAHVQQAVDDGARVVCGGRPYTEPPCDRGSWYLPTILENVSESTPCYREEVFGPVLVVSPYRHLDEAIALANDTDFGLGANVFTRDYRVAYRAARELNAGSVWVNMANLAQMAAPFGGNKNSGLGREYGRIGLHEYLKVKNHLWNMAGTLDPA